MTTLPNDEVKNRLWIRFLPASARTSIAGRFGLQAIVGNSAWLFLDKVLRMGVGLIVGVWVARYLGPGQFGILNYAVAFTSLFGAVATFGVDGIVIRELVHTPEKRNVILGSAFALKLLGGSVAFVVVLIAISLLRRGDTLTIWVVGLSAAGLIFQSLNVIDLLFQSQVQSRYTVYAANSAFILMALIKVALLLSRAPLLAFAWVTLGEIVATSLFLLIAYRTKGMHISAWRPRLGVMRDLVSASWPLMLSGISIMIATRVDQVLIGQMLNDKQVGIYSAAARIAEIWYFIPMGIAGSAFPMLVEAKKQSNELYYQRLQKLYNALVVLAVVFASITTLLAGTVVRLLYGAAYAASAGPLSILIWSGVPISIGCAWSNWMLLENRTRTLFCLQLNGAALNLILNLLLIPRLGIIGSAASTLLSYWLGSIGVFALMKSQYRALSMIGRAFSAPVVRLYRWNAARLR